MIDFSKHLTKKFRPTNELCITIDVGKCIAEDSQGNKFIKNIKLLINYESKRSIISFGYPCEYFLETFMKINGPLCIDAAGLNHKEFDNVLISEEQIKDIKSELKKIRDLISYSLSLRG